MPLAPGVRVGPYEIVAQIGVGGMGEVYRAKDTGLNRDVAVKVLPDEFAQDAERLARFEREAKTLASLNHPGIAILHGLERTDSTRALVMEFIDGPTLADRIAEGPLPVDEALAIANQIADALQAAHEQSIVHRDLKPANIKIRPDGTVKVLDFGLAKTVEPAGAVSGRSMSPTITSPAMTQAGVILGTAAYMAPEQAKGRGADKRSDVWALGCVIYEMLTGKRAFDGEDISDTLALILRGEPDWNVLPRDLPPAITSLLKRMLEKDRRRRVADVAAVSFVLNEPQFLTAGTGGGRRTGSSPIWIAAALLTGAALVGGSWWAVSRLRTPESYVVSRLLIPLHGEEQQLSPGSSALALSPDGKHLAYVASGRLYLRALNRLNATIVQGTESNATTAGDTRRPSFSPDSKWVGFIKDGQVRKAAVSGGPPITIAPARNASAFSWAEDGSLVLASQGSIFRVREGGGAPETLVDGLRGRVQSVELLPAERTILFTLFPSGTISPEASQIIARSLDTGREQIVARGGAEAKYIATGHVIYFSNGSLLAVPFDTRSFEVSGTPVPIADSVASGAAPGVAVAAAHVAVSNIGTLAYATGDQASNIRRLVWVDRLGKEEPLGLPDQPYVYPRLSPDDSFIAATVRDAISGDIWILDVGRKTARPLTTGPTDERYATWTPDGKRVAFGSSSRDGGAGTWWQAPDGSGTPQRLGGFPPGRFGNFVPTSVTPDGSSFVISATGGGAGGTDLWVLPTSGTAGPSPLLETEAPERNGEVSTDGRWLAFESIVDGRADIYVRPFPNVKDGVWRVSTGGGSQPVWSRDGRELFFLDGKNLLTGVTVESGNAFNTAAAHRVLSQQYIWSVPTYAGRQFDISRDGKRFLMMKDAGIKAEAPLPSITVVQNWFEELRRR